MYSYFILFLFGHIIGDFYFQTNKIAKNKREKLGFYILHCILYFAAIALVCVPVYNGKLVLPILVLIVSHAVIDLCKCGRIGETFAKCRFFTNKQFFIDQLVHIVCIFAVSWNLAYRGIDITVCETVEDILSVINMNYIQLVAVFLIVFINSKPYNVVIKEFTRHFKPSGENSGSSSKAGAGAMIGTMERWIITALCSLSQYSAIGLVLTAKSIARYKRITEDADFAEYYLMGTLLSTMLALITCIWVNSHIAV